jgi:hypothetical protein
MAKSQGHQLIGANESGEASVAEPSSIRAKRMYWELTAFQNDAGGVGWKFWAHGCGHKLRFLEHPKQRVTYKDGTALCLAWKTSSRR